MTVRLLSNDQFSLLESLCNCPSAIGFEETMVESIIKPFMDALPYPWTAHRFKGTPGIVFDSSPDAKPSLTIMLIAHMDKIRLQIRSIDKDGRLWMNTQSFLPASIIGHCFDLITENPRCPGRYSASVFRNLTAQGIEGIHFAPEALKAGSAGVKPQSIFLDPGIIGKDKKSRLENAGICPGQAAIFSPRPIVHLHKGVFSGPYLDNSLGCLALLEMALQISQIYCDLQGIRLLLCFSSHEEIGLMGGQIAAANYQPDILIGVDTCIDNLGAPGVQDQHPQPIGMGLGPVIGYGSVHSYRLMSLIKQAGNAIGLPIQFASVGAREGNDSMAAVNASIDAASTSISFPVRYLHTPAEMAYGADLLTGVDLLIALVQELHTGHWDADRLRTSHIAVDARSWEQS